MAKSASKAKNKKVTFPKSSLAEVFDCNEHEIGGLSPKQEADRLTITFWSNPSRKIIKSLLFFVLSSDEELKGLKEEEAQYLLEDFYHSLGEVIIDTNIEGLDFSTREAAEKSYLESPGLPMGFVHEAIATWLLNFMQSNLDLKKVARLLAEVGNSGNDDKQTVQDSQTD